METTDLDPRDFESRDAADKSVYVKFYMHPVRDDGKSEAEGRPIYNDREYLEIRTPGQQNNIIRRPVCDMDRQRFRKAYAMFKEGNEEQMIGTPLTEVGWLTRSQVEELAYVRIRTLEHLAAVGDDVCARMAGLLKLKQHAQKIIEETKGQAPIIELQKQMDELKNLVETQAATIRDQSQIIQRLQTDQSAKK